MFEEIRGRKIRLGLVGCGRIAKNHFGSIEKYSDDIELVSICETDKTVLADHKERYGVTGYRNMEEMLLKENLDVVSLCTPSGQHPEQTILAASHKVNVITEKPMATRWKDGVEMVKACDKARVRLFVVKQNRRNTTLQLLKKAVDEGRFGRIYMVNLNVFWTRPQEY